MSETDFGPLTDEQKKAWAFAELKIGEMLASETYDQSEQIFVDGKTKIGDVFTCTLALKDGRSFAATAGSKVWARMFALQTAVACIPELQGGPAGGVRNNTGSWS